MSLFLGIALIQSFFLTNLTAQNYNVDNTQPYEVLIPNLDVLHTNITFSKEDELKETVFYKDVDSHIIIGDIITSDTLTKYIETSDILTELDVSKIDASKRYRDSNERVIKKLEIHCDVFTLNKSLWLPEVDILIHARNVNFLNKSILKTDPRPWKEDKLAIEGKDGLQAGDIKIITKSIKDVHLEANGSDGAGVLFPQVSFTPPKTMESVEVYRCYPHLDEKFGDCSKRWDFDKNYNTIGIVFTNKDQRCEKAGKKPTLSTNDDNFKWDGKDISNLIDALADTRLKFSHRDYGKGGMAGNVWVASEDLNIYTHWSNQGHHGPYYKSTLPSIDDISLKYSTEGDIIKGDIKVTQKKKYVIGVGDNYMYRKWGALVCDDFWIKNFRWEWVLFDEVNTPTGENNFRKFNNLYDHYSYSPPIKVKTNERSTKNNFTPSIIYLKHKLILEKNKTKDYQSLSQDDKSSISKSIEVISEGVNNLEKEFSTNLNNASDEDEKTFFKLKLEEAKKLRGDLAQASKNVNERYLDEFDNPMGYRPVLSFPAINQLVKSDIDEDLELYIRANDAMKNINDRTKLVKDIPKLMTSLNTAIDKNFDDLSKNETQLTELGKEGESLAKEAKKLQEKLKKKETELREKAKKDAEQEKWVRIGAKTLAVAGACVATAYGGPAAGKFTYSMVDKLGSVASDKIYSKAENAEAVMQEVNIVPLLDKVRENKLAPVQSELADLEYRKNNNIFQKGFNGWKVDTTGNYITTKLPASLEQYKEKKGELEGKINKLNEKNEKINAMASFALKGGEEIYSTFVNTSYLNNAIDRVINKSQEYRLIGEEIKYNARENGKFAVRLRKELLNKGEITSKIFNLSNQKHELNNILADEEAYMDPLLANSMSLIQTQSLERLKWMEYQLIKVYNYTTLKPYPYEVANYRKLFSRELKSTNDISAKIDRMKQEYSNSLKNIKNAIVSHATNTHKQDAENEEGEYYGAKIFVNSKNALEALNDEKYYTIDLYNDFNDAIVQPDKNNIRIISFELEDFELSRPLKGSERIDLTITFDNKGVLRKDDKFYLFEDDKNSLEKWTWTLSAPKSGSNEQAKRSNASQNSEIYANMINYLIGDGGKVNYNNLFTLKPAWSKIKLSAKMENMDGEVEILKLKFNVRRDYEDVVTKQKVCDFRLNTNDSAARLIVKNTNDNKTDTLSHSQYNVLMENKNFSLEAKSVDPSRAFSHWETQPTKLAASAKGNTLELNVDIFNGRDFRVKPIFIDADIEQTVSSAKFVSLYEAPKLSSDVKLKVPLLYLKQNMEIKDSEVEGFQRVFYGFEEFFVNKKDLE
ncbi:MAG: hypothetical protein R3E32_22420 [Chitinophagales bacterium]